ncbi:MAG: DeoR/GlpR family DNA-binding transcription regulator [Pseudomonadota bacterium]
MLTTQRKKLIQDRLLQDGEVVAKSLSQEWGVSEDTIRRDLRELAQEGKLQRVHGGALPASKALATLDARQHIAANDKQALGRAGAAMVKPGQLVFLDGGTTALQLARHLDPALRATFVTHSPTVALELASKPLLDIIMLGGTLYRHSMVNVGAAVVAAAAGFRADLYFMGVTGVHATAGLSTGDFEEAAVKRALHAHAAETIVLASTEKLGAASSYVVAAVRELAAVVLLPGVPADLMQGLEAAGTEVIVAG